MKVPRGNQNPAGQQFVALACLRDGQFTGAVKALGEKIWPSAVGPPVETPMTSALGRSLRVGRTGTLSTDGEDGSLASTGGAGALLFPGRRKNCLILGISSWRRRAMD